MLKNLINFFIGLRISIATIIVNDCELFINGGSTGAFSAAYFYKNFKQ